jgi:iron complex transport system ATP-binding protein
MDEPTASLDLGHGQRVLELADELRREHALSVLCALHDLTIAGQYAEQLLVLSGGRVVLRGSPREVLTVPSIESIFEATVEVFDGRGGIVVAPARPARSGGSASQARGRTPASVVR